MLWRCAGFRFYERLPEGPGFYAQAEIKADFRFGTEEPLRYGYCITRVPEAQQGTYGRLTDFCL